MTRPTTDAYFDIAHLSRQLADLYDEVDMPATPERLWRALSKVKLAGGINE